MDGYLSKPVRAEELFQTIDTLVADGQLATPANSSAAPCNVIFDESLFLARMDGSYDVCVQIAEAFFVECPKLMSDLRLALHRKDAVELAGLAHGLKGTIANFTDGRAFQSAVKLEGLAKEADLKLAAEAFKRLETDVEDFLKSLRLFAGAVPRA